MKTSNVICKHCGADTSVPADIQCRNDLIGFLYTIFWDVRDSGSDVEPDHWYCPECIAEGRMPRIEPEQTIPATVEYRGFTITFVQAFGEGGEFPTLRCQIRENKTYFLDADLTREVQINPTSVVDHMISCAKKKIDMMYELLYDVTGSFHQMLEKQARREHIDQRMVEKSRRYVAQMKINDDFFKKL